MIIRFSRLPFLSSPLHRLLRTVSNVSGHPFCIAYEY